MTDPRCDKIAGAYRTGTALDHAEHAYCRHCCCTVVVASRRPCIERLHDQSGGPQRLSHLVSVLAWQGSLLGCLAARLARLKKVAAARANPVEASHKAKTRPKPEVKLEVVDPSPVPTGANGTLTPDDLRKWANSMAAMPSEPIVTILDRWPDEELPQHRTKPAAVEDPSLMKTRTIIMVIIMLMALLAVLIGVTVHRRSSHRMVH